MGKGRRVMGVRRMGEGGGRGGGAGRGGERWGEGGSKRNWGGRG